MKKLATRSAQYPLFAEFVFQHNDWVVDSVDQVKKTLGSTVALSADPAEPGLLGPVANTIVFDAINMPPYAVITGGEVIVETAYAGSTTALVNATSIMAAAGTRVALTMTAPLLANAGQNLRATIAYTVANATAGKVRVRVMYTIDGRGNEVVTA